MWPNDPVPPSDIWWAYVRQIADFLKPGDPPPAEVHPTQRHTQWIYTVGLKPLVDTGLNSVKAIGWRFLTGAGSDEALSAMVGQCSDGEVPKLAGLSRGPKVTSALHAARAVKHLAEVEQGKHDLLILTIPGILTEAFWLRTQNTPPEGAPTDWFVPFLSPSSKLRALQAYTSAAFLEKAKVLASERLAMDEPATEPLSKTARRPVARGRARIGRPTLDPNSQVRTTTA